MSKDVKREYRFLDSDDDRRALVADLRRVRREVINLARQTPEARWYEPRYHGWSLAAMLGHLQMMDALSLRLIQLALVGIRIPVSEGTLNLFNDVMARVFQKRVVATTLRGLERGEDRLADFIMRLPMDRFSRMVYDPAISAYLTVEQAVQELFLYHWQDHLQTLRRAEDMFYEPPARSSEV